MSCPFFIFVKSITALFQGTTGIKWHVVAGRGILINKRGGLPLRRDRCANEWNFFSLPSCPTDPSQHWFKMVGGTSSPPSFSPARMQKRLFSVSPRYCFNPLGWLSFFELKCSSRSSGNCFSPSQKLIFHVANGQVRGMPFKEVHILAEHVKLLFDVHFWIWLRKSR